MEKGHLPWSDFMVHGVNRPSVWSESGPRWGPTTYFWVPPSNYTIYPRAQRQIHWLPWSLVIICLFILAVDPPLFDKPSAIFDRPWYIVYLLPCRIPCRFSVHSNSLGASLTSEVYVKSTWTATGFSTHSIVWALKLYYKDASSFPYYRVGWCCSVNVLWSPTSTNWIYTIEFVLQ